MDIRLATVTDIPALTGLWDEAFGDPAEYMSDFFGTFFTPDYSAPAMFDGDTLVCALHLLEFNTISGGTPCGKSGYIYAAATSKSRRGEGHMSRLMDYTVSLAKQRGYSSLFLVPQDEPLFDFYSRLGFIPTFYKYTADITYASPQTSLRGMDICDDKVWETYYSAYKKRQGAYPLSYIKDSAFFDFTMSEYFASGGLIDEVVRNGSLRCWIMYGIDGDRLTVLDFIPAARDITAEDFHIDGFTQVSLTADKATIERLGLEAEAVPFGMAMPLSEGCKDALGQSGGRCYLSFYGD
ncbi:MAG: GNAT family N-acetyltransferase [Eubacteriales bacterium]